MWSNCHIIYADNKHDRVGQTFNAFENAIVKHTAVQNGFERHLRLTDRSKERSDITLLHQFNNVYQTLQTNNILHALVTSQHTTTGEDT